MLPQDNKTLDMKIREAVAQDRVVISIHARHRLVERRIPVWQVIDGLEFAKLLLTRSDAEPNPVIEVEIVLADGTPVKAIWAWLHEDEAAKLVTVHYFDD